MWSRSSIIPGIQTPTDLSVGAMEFRHPPTPTDFPPTCRSEQLASTSALEAALRSGTELVETIVACA